MGETMSEEEKKETGFQVKDRRRFTGGGDHRQEEKPEPPAAPAREEAEKSEKRPSGEKEGRRGRREDRPDASAPFPEIDFSTFVFSLSSSVLIHLGLAPDPVSGEQRQELGLAKQTIDILGMIQEKTRGNLTEEEKRMMDGILYDLRLRYVQEAKKE
jgi:hypothetical protein